MGKFVKTALKVVVFGGVCVGSFLLGAHYENDYIKDVENAEKEASEAETAKAE